MIYPTLIFILATFVLITIPRDKLRVLLPYGVVLGGLIDFLDDMVWGNLFRIMSYDQMGIFDASGHLFLAPLAWTLLVVFYLYFWPDDNRYVAYFYVLAWALLATGFSQVVHAAGLFTYSPWFYPFPMLITFLIRFAFIAWMAQRLKLIRI